MNMAHEIDGRILIIRQNGVTDAEEIIQAMNAAVADPRLQAGSHVLWDATDAPAQASAKKIRRLVAGFGSLSDKLSSRFAIVVENQIQFGVSRMLSAYSELVDVEVRVFFDVPTAKDWLLSRPCED